MTRRGPETEKAPAGEPVADLQRRRITVAAAMAVLGGAAITLTGCGGGGTPTAPSVGPSATPPPPSCTPGAACGLVAGDEQHVAVVTAAQLAAGGGLVLDITGTSSHGHLVTLSAQEVMAIRQGQRAQMRSSTALSHSHLVTFN